MNIFIDKKICWLWLSMAILASAQREEDVPLMSQLERRAVEDQSIAFNQALEPVLAEAAKSTVRIWSGGKRPRKVAYGTVIGDGKQVLTKWSEVERFSDALYIQTGSGESIQADVAGVYMDEDLALLDLKGLKGEVEEEAIAKEARLVPVRFYRSELPLGRFLTAPQPSGKPGAFGVVSVKERNLRETDQAHLGIMADEKYR
ncbi:MAG: hypothetical protein H7Y36_03145, partial [Armatimonadetes bacterium]|nr:hypothetical protein [Akkermansiaceae bacterium]